MSVTNVSYTMGYAGTVTINSASPPISNLRFGSSYSEVDTTTNKDGGNKTYCKGLKDMSISFDMQLSDDTAVATVVAAIESRDPVTCTATFTGSDTSITGTMHVFGGEITAGLDGVATMTVTCRPASTRTT